MDIKVSESGNLEINLHELFESIHDVDSLSRLAETFQWFQPAYVELIKTLRRDFAGETYNPSLFQLRRDFMTMEDPEDLDGSDALYQMKDTVKELIRLTAVAREETRRYSNARGHLYTWLKETKGQDIANEIHSKLIGFEYHGGPGDSEYAHTPSYDMIKLISLDEMVEAWVNEIKALSKKESPS